MKDNYPLLSQSEERMAPWNDKENMPKKVEVTVSITLSKTVEVEVNNYTSEEEIDEDGNHNIYYDYSNCDLEQAVRDQITLPNEAYNKLYHAVFLTEDYKAMKNIEDLKDWIEDDFAVNLEE